MVQQDALHTAANKQQRGCPQGLKLYIDVLCFESGWSGNPRTCRQIKVDSHWMNCKRHTPLSQATHQAHC